MSLLSDTSLYQEFITIHFSLWYKLDRNVTCRERKKKEKKRGGGGGGKIYLFLKSLKFYFKACLLIVAGLSIMNLCKSTGKELLSLLQ